MRPASRISCVLPVFNGERHIGETLDSILSQCMAPIEVVFVDDGSTDGTADAVVGFGGIVRLVRQEKAGPAAARNRGAAEATGELIAFGDADDLWHPERLACQAAAFERDPRLDVCLTWIRDFWDPDLAARFADSASEGLGTPRPGTVGQTGLVRRSFFRRAGGFLTGIRYHDAAEWQLRARDLGGVVGIVPEVLMLRRLHSNNDSRGRSADESEALFAAIKSSLDRRRAKGGTPSGTEATC